MSKEEIDGGAADPCPDLRRDCARPLPVERVALAACSISAIAWSIANGVQAMSPASATCRLSKGSVSVQAL